MCHEEADKYLWDKAYNNVKSTRGSDDVPGFDICVEYEFNRLKKMINNYPNINRGTEL